MKIIFLKTVLLLSLIISISCNAQRIREDQYANFYNDIFPKLNQIVPIKTQFYNQNFSNFLTELINNNINVLGLSVVNAVEHSKHNYTLVLYFSDDRIHSYGVDKQFQYPAVWITFLNEIPIQANNMILKYEGNWNSNFATFFSNMIIQKIEFVGINGYKNPDRTVK